MIMNASLVTIMSKQNRLDIDRLQESVCIKSSKCGNAIGNKNEMCWN